MMKKILLVLASLALLSPAACTPGDCSNDADCVGQITCEVPDYPTCSVESYKGEEGVCFCDS